MEEIPNEQMDDEASYIGDAISDTDKLNQLTCFYPILVTLMTSSRHR